MAWPLIGQDYPAYAGGLAAGLGVLLPLANDVPGRDISAAARPAFGAVGAALPADGAALALLLIHEFQHVKLGAVLDLYDLCDPEDRRLYYAPWRDDPRPLEPLLQGALRAPAGVTDFWRVHGAAGWPMTRDSTPTSGSPGGGCLPPRRSTRWRAPGRSAGRAPASWGACAPPSSRGSPSRSATARRGPHPSGPPIAGTGGSAAGNRNTSSRMLLVRKIVIGPAE